VFEEELHDHIHRGVCTACALTPAAVAA
jgi:hypothetical protein